GVRGVVDLDTSRLLARFGGRASNQSPGGGAGLVRRLQDRIVLLRRGLAAASLGDGPDGLGAEVVVGAVGHAVEEPGHAGVLLAGTDPPRLRPARAVLRPGRLG